MIKCDIAGAPQLDTAVSLDSDTVPVVLLLFALGSGSIRSNIGEAASSGDLQLEPHSELLLGCGHGELLVRSGGAGPCAIVLVSLGGACRHVAALH